MRGPTAYQEVAQQGKQVFNQFMISYRIPASRAARYEAREQYSNGQLWPSNSHLTSQNFCSASLVNINYLAFFLVYCNSTVLPGKYEYRLHVPRRGTACGRLYIAVDCILSVVIGYSYVTHTLILCVYVA